MVQRLEYRGDHRSSGRRPGGIPQGSSRCKTFPRRPPRAFVAATFQGPRDAKTGPRARRACPHPGKKEGGLFFLIAGIQPKTIRLEEQPQICPSCGLYQAFRKRVDHYVAVFFLPIVRVKQGDAFLECRSCGSLSDERGEPFKKAGRAQRNACPSCGRTVERSHRYCPFCGKPLVS
jgi:RNA polymerase subunit RPABC4/transcription elongation factor Spt4